MKKYLVLILTLQVFSFRVYAQRYHLVDAKSKIHFKVSHQMIFKNTVKGSLKGLKGSIDFDPKNLPAASFDASVNAESINTGVGLRDKDLRKEKYFNVEKFPEINIRSRSITKTDSENGYLLNGVLTLKGKSLPISFPFIALPMGSGYSFKGHFHISRLNFDIGSDNSIDKDVEIDLDVIAE